MHLLSLLFLSPLKFPFPTATFSFVSLLSFLSPLKCFTVIEYSPHKDEQDIYSTTLNYILVFSYRLYSLILPAATLLDNLNFFTGFRNPLLSITEVHKRKKKDYMSYEGVDQMDHMVDDDDDGDMADSFDGIDQEFNNNAADDANLNEYDLLMQVTDTSASQARKGKDIQGIPWDRLNISRQSYRITRLQQYTNYENIPSSGEAVDKECKPTKKGGRYFDFIYNTRLVKPTILHFQLRNLVWATSKHDVYFVSNYSVMHWSSLSQNLTEVLNFSDHIVPTERNLGNLSEGFTRTQLSTVAVKDRLLVAGGFHGEIICKYLDKPGVSFCTRTTHRENAITNAIEIFESSSSGMHFTTSNNDCGVREYDTERFQLLNHFNFPWPVNHTSMSPDRKLMTVVGDDLDGLIVDARNGKTVSSIVGHFDYSFASAWHPDGRIFATGNQDKTCRVWDLRNMSAPTATLKSNLGAVRSLRFSNDGLFLVVAEPADFVHIYSTKDSYETRQELDFFGEISGVSLSPDDESIYVGIWDRTYASLLQYNRRHTYEYLDSLI